MFTHDHIETLAALPLFEPVPRGELEWLCARGDARTLAPGTILWELGASVEEMWILLSGSMAAYAPKAGTWRKIIDGGPGFVLGAMPYSRMQAAQVRIMAEDESSLLVLSRSHFSDLVRECPELTAVLVRQLIDRARNYRMAQAHDERMQSLGRLAAGLAHELNNPASGATSHARSLASLLDEMHGASKALARAHLTDDQLESIDALRSMCIDLSQPRGPLDVADREDEFSDWLLEHDVDPVAASTLATANVSVTALDHLATVLPAETLGVAVRWAVCDAALRHVASQIMAATGRIHDLVSAVKGFTFMDREGVREDVDIARGLADTVAMLESKTRAKSVRVRIDTAENLPKVHGYGSELNQVWEKLIDNAVDAVRAGGTVTVTATSRGDFVVVRVMDDGPGIPDEHQARIFDPFFTTKPVGHGTGLGLDVARRFAHLNDGDIDFTSQPGHTVFRVRLPVAGTER